MKKNEKKKFTWNIQKSDNKIKFVEIILIVVFFFLLPCYFLRE